MFLDNRAKNVRIILRIFLRRVDQQRNVLVHNTNLLYEDFWAQHPESDIKGPFKRGRKTKMD